MNPLNPKKLLLTKWTAVHVTEKQKHFLVSKVIQADDPNVAISEVEIEAIYSHKKHVIAWRDLQDSTLWKQGWL
jgi:tryptophan-rich hypothetical protein